MNRIIIIISCIVLLISKTYGQTQFSQPDLLKESESMAITTIGEFSVNSTALSNKLYNSFLFGNYIEQASKDRISSHLSQYNLMGMDLNYGIFFSQRLDSLCDGSLSYFIKMANRMHVDATFTQDFFNLGLYGNKMYAGDTALLANTELSSVTYQQILIGMAGKNKNNSLWGVGASFLKGQSYFHTHLERANLYTSPTGEFIDLDLKMSMVQSDTAQNTWNTMNGWGFSTDLFYEIPYDLLGTEPDSANSSGWTGYLRMEINDLGFINWNNNTMNYLSDTSYHFEGIYFDNVLELNDSVLSRMTDSVADTYLPSVRNGSFTSLLPTWLHFSMYQENAAGYSLSMGAYMRLLANYSPGVCMKVGRTFNEKYKLSGLVEFGGYGKINLGWDLTADWNGFKMALGTRNMLAWIIPEYTRGNSLYISLTKEL